MSNANDFVIKNSVLKNIPGQVGMWLSLKV